MDETTQQDFFCTQCSLQFGKKYVFDVHLSLVHGKKDVTITNEGSKISFGESQKDGDSNTGGPRLVRFQLVQSRV